MHDPEQHEPSQEGSNDYYMSEEDKLAMGYKDDFDHKAAMASE
jgi:hypothetical protein